MKRILFIVALLGLEFCSSQIWAQGIPAPSFPSFLDPPECNIKSCKQMFKSMYSTKRSLSMVFLAKESNDSIKTFEIRNSTDSTFFIYSGYIYRACYHQPYLHQIDTMNNDYYLSLTPTYGYYKMYHAFKNVSLVTDRNWNDFVELRPTQFYRFQIRISKEYFSLHAINAIQYFNPYEFEQALVSPMLNKNSIKNYKNNYLQVAVYKDVSVLCKSYIVNKNKLNLQSLRKDFFVLKTRFNGFK